MLSCNDVGTNVAKPFQGIVRVSEKEKYMNRMERLAQAFVTQTIRGKAPARRSNYRLPMSCYRGRSWRAWSP